MKRLLLICILAVCALPLPAQEEEGLFTLERTFELPGVSAQEVHRRAKKVFSLLGPVSSTKYQFDADMYLHPVSEWGNFSYIGLNLISQKKEYRCYLTLYVEIVFGDGFYTARLGEVRGSAYRNTASFPCVVSNYNGFKADDIHEYDGYLHKKKKLAAAQMIKAFATTEFEKLLLEIEAVMKQPSAVPLEAFSLYEELW